MEFLPFTRPHIDDETIESVIQVFRSGWLATGPKNAELENQIAIYLGLKNNENVFVKAFTSATGALEIALRVMGVGPGDEVIVPAMSFAASANVVCLCGAKPVFTDVDPETRNLTLSGVKKAFTVKTKAIMPVHFAGLSVDLEPILSFAQEKSIRVIEDAAHAIGTRYHGKNIGSFGDMISFSFHPNKNMTTIEGGALILFKKEEAQKVDRLRFHGIQKDAVGNLDVIEPSGKFNLTDVSAAVGIGQLKRLDEFCRRRRELAMQYFSHLKDNELMKLPARGDEGHAWHMFAPLINFEKAGMTRSDFIKKMAEQKIGIGLHYTAMHLFTAYKAMGYHEGQFPNAERVGRETVTLPLFPMMKDEDVKRVCEAMKLVLASR